MGHEKGPFDLLACALLASCGPVSVSTSEQIADSTSTSSYFRFDMEDVYASCGSSVPLVYSTNLSSYEIRSSDEDVAKIVDGVKKEVPLESAMSSTPTTITTISRNI